MWSSAQGPATFALLWGLVSCGPAAPAQEAMAPAAAPLVPPPIQDQQFLLDPVPVKLSTAGPSLEPTGEPGRVHSASKLRQVALAGSVDAHACQKANEGEVVGQVVVSLEIDEDGRVLGGATSPAGGEEGLAAVADCLLIRARAWHFPSRSTPGRTVLRVPFDFVSP